jgi:hypothetical protein
MPARIIVPVVLLATVLASAWGCASNRSPDDPAYDSEENSNEVLMDEEREWEERDADL